MIPVLSASYEGTPWNPWPKGITDAAPICRYVRRRLLKHHPSRINSLKDSPSLESFLMKHFPSDAATWHLPVSSGDLTTNLSQVSLPEQSWHIRAAVGQDQNCIGLYSAYEVSIGQHSYVICHTCMCDLNIRYYHCCWTLKYQDRKYSLFTIVNKDGSWIPLFRYTCVLHAIESSRIN